MHVPLPLVLTVESPHLLNQNAFCYDQRKLDPLERWRVEGKGNHDYFLQEQNHGT